MTLVPRPLRGAAHALFAAALAIPLVATSALAAAPGDTLEFSPLAEDSELPPEIRVESDRGSWLRTPFGERLLTDADEWSWRGRRHSRVDLLLDYNRVDPFRFGLGYQAQAPGTMYPRLGARLEYATGRERTLYGVQLEQPLVAEGWLSGGVAMVRRTDHAELHQVDDLENSLALLFGRQDYRDYFEREGFGAYLASRLGGLSTLSLHLRNDEYRSLTVRPGTRSLFHRDRSLRDNPPIAEGEAHRAIVRLERLAHHTLRTRAGLYHWLELEAAGRDLGGDFDYLRMLGDVRSVLRLSPATTLALRVVGGSNLRGFLPPQRDFTVGGVDGLRAHRFAQFRGDQMLLGQAEYTVGLWHVRSAGFEGGLHAIAFLDAGKAWTNAGHQWDLGRQRVAVDGGIGLSTSEDDLRVYFARDLGDPDAPFVISARLVRPF